MTRASPRQARWLLAGFPTHRLVPVSFPHLRPEEQTLALARHRHLLVHNRHLFSVSIVVDEEALPSAFRSAGGPASWTRRQVFLHGDAPEVRRGLHDVGVAFAETPYGSFVEALLAATPERLHLTEHHDRIRTADAVLAAFVVRRWPSALTPSLLSRLLPEEGAVRLNLTFRPLGFVEASRRLRRLSFAAASLLARSDSLSQRTGTSMREELQEVWRAVEVGATRLYEVATVVLVVASDEDLLRRQGGLVVERFGELGFDLRLARYRQLESVLSTLDHSRSPSSPLLLEARALAQVPWFGLGGGTWDADPEAVLGYELDTRSPFVTRRGLEANPTAFVFGQPGSGKSAFVKALLLREARLGHAAFVVVDPEGEYGPVLAEIGHDAPGAVVRYPREVPWDELWSLVGRMRRQGVRTHVAIDEAHLFLERPEERRWLRAFVKRARKWGVIVTVSTQNVHDFLANFEGRTMVATAGAVWLFRQSPIDLEAVGRHFRLAEGHLAFLAQARPGECLLVDAFRAVPVRIVLREGEHALVDTAARTWHLPKDRRP